MSWIKNFSIVILVSLLSLEGVSFVATRLNLFLVNETPSLYESGVNTEYQDIAYGRTEREKWGLGMPLTVCSGIQKVVLM